MRICKWALSAGFLLAATSAAASEVSFVSGVYRYQATKVDRTDTGSQTNIGAGLRYADPIEGRLFWYAQGDLGLASYTKGSGPSAPSNGVNLNAGGGVRYYFQKLADRIEPYVLAGGNLRNDKLVTYGANSYTQVERNGLYYHSDFGIRLSLQKEFFVDFELPLSESGLFATEKTTDVTGTTSTTSEKQRIELFAQSTGPFNGMNVALGFRF